MSDQLYKVVMDKGWASDSPYYGARVIVIAPIGGNGYPPQVNGELRDTGLKSNGRPELSDEDRFELSPADARLLTGDLSDHDNDTEAGMKAILALDSRMRNFLGADPKPEEGHPTAGFRTPDMAPTDPPLHPGYGSNHPGGPAAPPDA